MHPGSGIPSHDTYLLMVRLILATRPRCETNVSSSQLAGATVPCGFLARPPAQCPSR